MISKTSAFLIGESGVSKKKKRLAKLACLTCLAVFGPSGGSEAPQECHSLTLELKVFGKLAFQIGLVVVVRADVQNPTTPRQ